MILPSARKIRPRWEVRKRRCPWIGIHLPGHGSGRGAHEVLDPGLSVDAPGGDLDDGIRIPGPSVSALGGVEVQKQIQPLPCDSGLGGNRVGGLLKVGLWAVLPGQDIDNGHFGHLVKFRVCPNGRYLIIILFSNKMKNNIMAMWALKRLRP
jgi:hypothetical protein